MVAPGSVVEEAVDVEAAGEATAGGAVTGAIPEAPTEADAAAMAVETRRPDWRLCRWWALIGTASSLISVVPTAVAFSVEGFSPSTLGWLMLAVDVSLALAVAGLQAWLLKSRGINAVAWIVVAVGLLIWGGVDSYLLFVGMSPTQMWHDFVARTLDLSSYSPERPWVPLVGPALVSLPSMIVTSVLQGMVVARRGPLSRLWWWVLACTLGGAVGGIVGSFARDFTQVMVYLNVPDTLYVSSGVGVLSGALTVGLISSLAQGIALALFFRRGNPRVYHPVEDPKAISPAAAATKR